MNEAYFTIELVSVIYLKIIVIPDILPNSPNVQRRSDQ